MEILFFVAGVATFYTRSYWPLVFMASCTLTMWTRLMIGMFILGFGWSCLHQHIARWQTIPRDRTMLHAVTLEGAVAAVPQRNGDRVQFEFWVARYHDRAVREQITLTCFKNCPDLTLGQSWKLRATLKQYHRYHNEGVFDGYTLEARHIFWRGVVHTFKRTHRKTRVPMLIKGLIWRVRHASCWSIIADDSERGVIEALTLGLTHHLHREDWDLFRRTGTTHLMVISGAHIGLVAWMMYQITHVVWRRLGRLCEFLPAGRFAGVCACLGGMAYAGMAGFGVPAQRAVLSFFMISLRYFLPIVMTSTQSWRYALFLVVMFEPHVVQLPGFYLSFMAVAVLLTVGQRLKTSPLIFRYIALQLACLCGLFPMTLYVFHYASLTGLLANLVAIPWVSFILIPVSLCCMPIASLKMGVWVSKVLSLAAHVLLYYLHWVDRFSFVNVSLYLPSFLSLFLMFLGLFIIFFMPWRAMYCWSILFIVSSFMPFRHGLQKKEVSIDFLDVGEGGLAVVIRTARHALLYNTSTAWHSSMDITQRVVLPYLKSHHIERLDAVAMRYSNRSHLKNFGSIPIHTVWGTGTWSCLQGARWRWEGVLFEWIPMPGLLYRQDHPLCVLRISTSGYRTLLAGDIEFSAERDLVRRLGQDLAADVLSVPRYGSRTASSDLFLEKVHPMFAVVSYGLHHRYRLPHQDMLNRYTKRHIPVYGTALCGMIRVRMGPQGIEHTQNKTCKSLA